jgi:predicted transcriptional regulator
VRRKRTAAGGERPTASVYVRLGPSVKERLEAIADGRRQSLNCMVAELLEELAAGELTMPLDQLNPFEEEAAAGGLTPGGLLGREEGQQPPAAAVFDWAEGKESNVQVQLESTDKVVTLNGVPARIWEGHTACGVPCHAYITRIAVDKDLDTSEFVRELQEHRPVSEELRAFPARLVL